MHSIRLEQTSQFFKTCKNDGKYNWIIVDTIKSNRFKITPSFICSLFLMCLWMLSASCPLCWNHLKEKRRNRRRGGWEEEERAKERVNKKKRTRGEWSKRWNRGEENETKGWEKGACQGEGRTKRKQTIWKIKNKIMIIVKIKYTVEFM